MINIGNIEHTNAKYIFSICDKNGVIKAKVAMPDDAIQCKQLMKEDYIQFSFTYCTSILFVRSDYAEYQGTKYYLRSNCIPNEVDSSQFKYILKFESEVMLLQDTQFYYTRQQAREASWSLTSDAASFIQVAVDNANRYFGSNQWKVGRIEPAERKYINFNNTNVFDALINIAQQFDAEWYVTNKTINLVKKFTFGSEIEFESEVNINGISRSEGENSAQYTRILALGSTRNLPVNYRQTGNDSTIEAVYQKRLRIPAAKGDVIDIKPNLSPNEVVETTVVFDDVYPKRVGKITEVTTKENTDKDNNTGASTTWNSYRFKDSELTFKSSYLLKDKDAELRIVFQSGKLNGLDFAVHFDPDNEGDNSPKSQVFEILRNENYGKSLPNDILKPDVNDEYIMYGFDVQMVSNTYIPAAEQALYDKAMEWLQNNAKDKSVYSCPTVINAFSAKEMDLDVGQKVKLVKGQGGGRNLILNTGFQNAFTNWNANGGTRSIIDDMLYGKIAKIVATGSGHGIYQSCTNRVTGSTYTISTYIKADKAMKIRLNHEGGTGSKTFNVTTAWQRYETFGVWNTGGSIGFYADEAGTFYLANVKYEKGNQASDWSLAPEDVEEGMRGSRIMGFEKKLYNKYDAVYTVGENTAYSRLASIEKSIDEIKYADQIFENTGNGSNVYLIKQFDNTTPTEFNAYSAKASDTRYLNKQTGGTVEDDTIFARNMQVQGTAISDVFQNSTFTAGQLGSGFQIKRDANGQSYMEVDNLMVRREAVFNRLTIAEIKSVGGSILLSPANMLVSKVEKKTSAWRCYFDNLDGTVPNDFAVGDQAICRRFTGKDIKYYWALVTAVGADYIELSETDKDGSGVPAAGDEVVQLGNRTDVNRQYAIMLSTYGSDAPSIKQYARIDSYDLTGKEVTSLSPKGNKFAGSFIVSTHGTTAPIYKEMGVFNNGTVYYLNDRVSYLGSYWVCIVNTTITTPSEGSSTWRKETAGQTDINKAADQARTEYKADFAVLDTKIASKVSQTDFNALGNRMLTTESNITQLAGSITSVVQRVNTIQGRNLIRSTSKSNFDQSLWYTGGWSNIRPVWNDTENALEFSAHNGWQTSSIVLTKPTTDDEDITISFKVKQKDGFNVGPVVLGVNNSTVHATAKTFTPTSEWVYHEYTFNATGARFLFTIRGVDNSGKHYKVLVKDLMFEKGNKASSWSPAPEDVQAKLESVQSQIAQTAESIELKVSKMQIGGVNLLNNSSFENGYGESVPVNSSTIARIAGGYNGSYCMRAITTNSAQSGYCWQNLPTEAGKEYVVSCYVKADTPITGCTFGAYTSGWVWVTGKAIDITKEWTRIDINFTATASLMKMCILKANVTFYVDCLQLEEGNKTTSWNVTPADTLNEVKTSLKIEPNGVTMFGKTFTVNSSLIAKAIETGELSVGRGNFKVGTDGKMFAKEATIEGNINLVWDGDQKKAINSINVIDSAGDTAKTRILIKPTNITSIDNLGKDDGKIAWGANNSGKLAARITTNSNSPTSQHYKSGILILPKGKKYDIFVPAIKIMLSYSSDNFNNLKEVYGSAECDIYLVDNNSGLQNRIASFSQKNTGSLSETVGGSTPISYSVDGGSYYVLVTLRISGQAIPGGVSGYGTYVDVQASFNTSATDEIKGVSLKQFTEIGFDGIAAVWSTAKYFHATSDKIEIKYGKYGFRVNDKGIFKMVDGVNWVSL